MDHSQVDPKEMEMRQNKDYIASLKMVGEGAPVYDFDREEAFYEKKPNEEADADIKLPRDYQ
ncbi:hypothetical protein ACFSFY_16815 [Sporosarcina siberiensis]|uniref:YfhE-like protein n=1 Tax=Sporosarcina siberiensis TaxID=1365606 RepID=A0ABW4SJI2_9BACL